MNLTMKEIPEGERPYEKCALYGAEALSDAELLAILFRTGTRSLNSVELAQSVLKEAGGSLAGLYDRTERDFRRIPGIGTVKATQLAALKVLSGRMVRGGAPFRADFSHPEAVFRCYAGQFRGEKQEVLKALFLNGKCRLLRDFTASRGAVNQTMTPVREIFVEALKAEAVYMILMHNHPSGDPTPSDEDLKTTERLKKAGELCGVTVLDHIIFGDNRYVSLRDQGWIT